ncbi:hypothetical protein TNCV_1719851 [Trichonephila clavipes]|nr:hypothetical protein TNCV_1719851 [Trichonephila clavipes]
MGDTLNSSRAGSPLVREVLTVQPLELMKERGFSERTLDAEVDDPGLKKQSNEKPGGRVGTHQPVVHERDA